jgi:hypothetical protein
LLTYRYCSVIKVLADVETSILEEF